MGVREIPAKWVYTCDMCGTQEIENQVGHQDRPTTWEWLRSSAGMALLLCPASAQEVKDAIDKLMEAHSAERVQTDARRATG